MGLTQVMLQVKGCEMVCKQRELIPRLKRLSPAGTVLNSYLPPPPPPPPFTSLLPPMSSLSNSLRQHSAEAVRGHQKGTQTQREMPSAYKNETRSGSIQFTPLAQHQSTSIHQHHHRRASESAALYEARLSGYSQLPVIQRPDWFYKSITFERLGCGSEMIHRFIVRRSWLLWMDIFDWEILILFDYRQPSDTERPNQCGHCCY